MKTLLLFFVLFGSIGMLNAQTENCYDNIKTGTFEYEYDGKMVTLVRTKKKQVELNDDGTKIISKIRWISDTEYVTTFIKTTDPSAGALKKGLQLKVSASKCKGDKHTIMVRSNFSPKFELILIKIK